MHRVRNFQIIKSILIVLLIMFVAYIGYITYQIRSAESGSGNLFKRVPEQQIVVITDDQESYAHLAFMEGANEAGERLNVVVQIETIENGANESEIKDAFYASIYSHVDGIVVNLASNDRAESFIKASEARGIPVVVVGNDSITSERSAYIGTNKYNLGLNVGELVVADQSAKKVLVVFDFNYTDKKGASTNNYLNGFLSVLNETKDREIQTLFLEEGQRIESTIKVVLEENKPDYIIATDPINSIRLTKALIDLNEIGNVKIIASSKHPDIVNYLKKGTIEASAVEDYSYMGSEAIQTLYGLVQFQSPSAYQAMPFEIVTRETVGEFDESE